MDIFYFLSAFRFAKSVFFFKKFGFCLLLIGPGFEVSLSKDFSLPFLVRFVTLVRREEWKGELTRERNCEI